MVKDEYRMGFGFLLAGYKTKKLHWNGTFHPRSVVFSTLPKQLKLVGTGRNWFDPV